MSQVLSTGGPTNRLPHRGAPDCSAHTKNRPYFTPEHKWGIESGVDFLVVIDQTPNVQQKTNGTEPKLRQKFAAFAEHVQPFGPNIVRFAEP